MKFFPVRRLTYLRTSVILTLLKLMTGPSEEFLRSTEGACSDPLASGD